MLLTRHQPIFSAANSISLEGATSKAFWQLLYQYGADVVLNGHDHLYARYRPLDPSGNYDPKKGIREFTGGSPFSDQGVGTCHGPVNGGGN